MLGDGRRWVAVDSRLAAAVAARARGEGFSVAAACRDLGVTRQTFYKYLRRFRAEGVEGFFPRSRAPLTQPTRTPADVEDAVVRARKELDEYGADCGAVTIRWRLEDDGVTPLPARATVHRVLLRRGQVSPQPRKRPTSSSSRRFAADRPNQMWQLDGLEYTLADGQTATVIQVIDDCSRLDLACRAAASENSADVWAAVQDAIGRHGLPRQLLTDNGSALNGSRRGFTTDLEARMRALGVTPIASSPHHPQTCGKDERAHQTLRRWLRRRPPANDIGELQALLDQYRDWYNTRRRHQGIDGLTPQQRYDLADKAGPGRAPIPDPPAITRPVVSPRGAIGVDGCEIALAKRFSGHQATAFRTGDHVVVFIGPHAVRTLDIDRSRRYQPSGINPRTGQPKRR
jgi:transposase InsO family protein